MNKQYSYLVFWFFVVFVIQGFRMFGTTVNFEAFLEREHNKYEEITGENINTFIELTKLSKNFPKINRIEFITFFHSAYFIMQNAHDMIVNHYEIRKNLPIIFGDNKQDPEIRELIETKTVVSHSILFSDSYQPTGYRYVYTSIIDKKPASFNFIKNVRYFFYMIKCLIIEYGTFDGVIVIMNAEGFTMAHAFKFKMRLVRSLLKLIVEAPQLRIKKIFILNTNQIVQLVYNNVVKRFLPEDFRKKVVFCAPDSTTVYDDIDGIPKTIMPIDGYKDGLGPSHVDQALKTYELMEKFHNKYGPNSDN